eukprot:TRINITY_DN2899_c0_g1_i1.p1 TRINITY_DN2899_c0_g1~~TRINITY_DN2899_c0_g1_i1.p1  ORF type:complete len:470 (+),score=67.62 TRINITY_DN2899_c0_g1_i1:161-1570(+)
MQSPNKDGPQLGSLGTPEKDGWLTKRGGKVQSWKKRWCVLKGRSIWYYKTNKSDCLPQGSIDLEPTTTVSTTTVKKRNSVFVVVTERRHFYISADSDSIRDSWIQAITSAVEKLEAKPASTPAPKPVEATKTSENGTGATTAAPPTSGGANAVVRAAPTGARSARAQLANAKSTVPFVAQEDSKVFEFWQIWSESIPPADKSGPVEFYVSISASMQKLNWRTAGPQHIFIQKMVDFFWGVGAPESEIDKLNDVGASINPVKIGSWIDMSAKGGMDGGWYFPVEVTVQQAFEAADDGQAISKVREWCAKHAVENCLSVGRDMGAAPPRQTEIQLRVPGANPQDQVRIALEAFDMFGFPKIPDNALKILHDTVTTGDQLRLSIITASDGFVRIGVLVPQPSAETVSALCNTCTEPGFAGNHAGLLKFEGALGVSGPSYVEYQYLMKNFGYSVYKEGFDIIFHYDVGSEIEQ